MLRPVFTIVIHDLDTGLECVLSLWVGDTNFGAVDSLEGREALQRDLGRLEGWAITNWYKIYQEQALDSAPGMG